MFGRHRCLGDQKIFCLPIGRPIGDQHQAVTGGIVIKFILYAGCARCHAYGRGFGRMGGYQPAFGGLMVMSRYDDKAAASRIIK